MESLVRATKVFDAVTIAAGSASTSGAVQMAPMDAMALHLTSITGTTPSCTFTYSLGITDTSTFIVPQSPATIGATKAAVDVMDFVPECSGWIKIIATNAGTGPIVITAYLAQQEKM